MTLSTYEPTGLEIFLTLALGRTLLSPYYRGFVRDLHLDPRERVLDFGSGSGVCSRHIAAQVRQGHLACVDISHKWVGVLRKTLRPYRHVSYHLGRITELDLPAAAFDRVILHFVLHDIPAEERPAVVQALARRLRPNGRLHLREPQGHELEAAELAALAAAAGLRCQDFSAHKTAAGSVFDAEYRP